MNLFKTFFKKKNNDVLDTAKTQDKCLLEEKSTPTQEVPKLGMKEIKRYSLENIESIYTSIIAKEDTAIFLCRNNESIYQLLVICNNEIKSLDIGYHDKCYTIKNTPVLFSQDGYFGIIKDPQELILYSNESKIPQTIQIENSQILPKRVCLCHPSPVSDSNILPVCFEGDGFVGIARYMAFLLLDSTNKKAKWIEWGSLEPRFFPHHHDKQYPPKLDGLMIKNQELYAFSSGGKITSINKWGMDYYALVKSHVDNISVLQSLFESGDLHSIDNKKRGVNGLFTCSQKYVILTPVFQSDEWKGKQKIFLLDTNEICDVLFPRGFGKYPRIIQHYGDKFFVFLRDTNEVAVCQIC